MAKARATVAFQFDARIPSAERVAARQAAQLVTNVSAETRAALRLLVTRGLREGIPVFDLARIIQTMVGMNRQQAAAALNYRESLVNLGQPLARVNTLMDRYVAKKIRSRALTISRSETMSALNRGALESWQQAQKAGLLGKTARIEWIATAGACPNICAPLDGVAVPLGSDFPGGGGSGPPAHPRCRCASAVLP